MGAMLLGSCGQKQETPSASSQDTAQVSISDTATVATSDTQNSQTVNEIRTFVHDTGILCLYARTH